MQEHVSFDPHHLPDAHLLDTAQLDQHLLSNPRAVRALIDAGRPNRRDVIADLGAGTGLITRALHDQHGPSRIYAIEIDRRFGPCLEHLGQRSAPHVELVWGDILACRLPDVTKVIANPPFRITEQLIEWLYGLPALTSASLVMGQSFGVSATARPGTPQYNRLSLKVQARFATHFIVRLSKTDFHPSARRPACIINLVPNRTPAAVDAIVDAALTHRSGMKVKDLLWYLQWRGQRLGPPILRRQIVTVLRKSGAVNEIYQRRLQQVTSGQLSELMAELHRLADTD